MSKLILELEKCVNNGVQKVSCPYCGNQRTTGAGFAIDYFCKLTPDEKSSTKYKITSGYVEWDREINPIPIWCPLLSKDEKALRILEN
jgi:hypothetical protein